MMAGGVAHDLNNILSGIVSYPELLLLQLPKDSKLRKPIEAIQDSGERAATVVADLLTVARGAASIRAPHDINVLIHDYLVSPEYKKLRSLHPDVICIEQLDAKCPVISCSPIHIKKTVMNLMTNAMEASGSDGTASYTVGQVVYTTETGTNGYSIAQGVQQPFEISVVTGIKEAKDISLSVSAYPNPTSDYLIVKVEN